MERKKLIGTIIGVTMFALLIVGATYAWLSATIDVNNGTYQLSTRNFIIDYEGGGQIENAPIVATATVTPEALATANAKKVITAKLMANSIAGKLTLYLTTTKNNLLTQSGALNYAVCVSTDCTTNFTKAAATGTIQVTAQNWVQDSTTKEYSYKKEIYVDSAALTTTAKNYYVYFWLDGDKVTNAMLSGNNNEYSGYIHASAEQVDR